MKKHITEGDIIEMRNGKAYLVLEGNSFTGNDGTLLVVEIDEDNKPISTEQTLELSISTQIRDIIR